MDKPVHRSIVDQVTDTLRAAILSGELVPGTHLTERWVADEMDVGTIPVREAFSTLTHEGLIERIPRRGAFVTAPPFELVHDLSDLREFLEVAAAGRAAKLWEPRFDRRAEEALAAMRVAIAADDLVGLGEADALFHSIVAEASGSSVLREFAALVRSRLARLVYEMRMDEETTGDPTDVLTIHERLLESIRTRSAEVAEAEMRRHVRATESRIDIAARRYATSQRDVPARSQDQQEEE